jgi:hypothetical protein
LALTCSSFMLSPSCCNGFHIDAINQGEQARAP